MDLLGGRQHKRENSRWRDSRITQAKKARKRNQPYGLARAAQLLKGEPPRRGPLWGVSNRRFTGMKNATVEGVEDV